MSRKLLTVAALTFFALHVAAAHAQMGYGVAAGLSAPTGNFGNSVDAGYNVTGMLTFSAPLAPVGLRVEGSFNEFNYKSTILSGAKARLLSGTANVVFSSPGIMGPYLIGGLGIYDASTSCSGCTLPSSSKIGFNGGGGFKFGLSGFSAFLEARYHYIPVSGSSTSFIPVSFGVTF
jgi:hypothetical protein